jgi:RNA polymerase-binding transcription factor DksA
VSDSPDQIPEPAPASEVAEPTIGADAERPAADLDRIERDLAGVETALQRLDAGTYWTDESTGESIPDEVLINDPVARRAG